MATASGSMARFSERMVAEMVQTFWAAMARGELVTDAAEEAGTYRKKGARWLRDAGGVRPQRRRDLNGRCLTFAEREDIALGPTTWRCVCRPRRSTSRCTCNRGVRCAATSRAACGPDARSAARAASRAAQEPHPEHDQRQ
jgi:hypothetical protein